MRYRIPERCQNQSERIIVRVTPDTREAIEQAAQQAAGGNISAFMRQILDDAVKASTVKTASTQ